MTRSSAARLVAFVTVVAAGACANESRPEQPGSAVSPGPPETEPSSVPNDDPPPKLVVEYDGPCPKGMKLIDGGNFTPAQRESLEARFKGPGLTFDVEPFCLAVHETTNAEFHECIAAGLCVEERDFPTIPQPEHYPCMTPGGECTGEVATLPVWNINSDGAQAYCEFRGWRSQTFIEWYWAATGGDEARPYPWGDARPSEQHLNVCDEQCIRNRCCEDMVEGGSLKQCADPDCLRKARPVFEASDGYLSLAPPGTYPKGTGRWGHMDLLGNAAEVVTIHGVEHGCGGDAASEADYELDLNRHKCLHTPSTALRGIRCAAEPRQP